MASEIGAAELTVFGTVCYQILFDGVDISVNDGGILELGSQ